ncbi:MAG: hypothetical protein WC239_10970 [Sphaerochaetaceae bacterium]
MKKMITILMVLLVTTMAFAAYTAASVPTASTVDITTSNDGVLAHKITAGSVSNNSTWNSATAITEAIPVNIGVTTEQSVAFYSVRTNTKKTVAVTVTADALHTGTAYYIPYTLKVGAETGNFGTYAASSTAPTTTPSITLNTVVLTPLHMGCAFYHKRLRFNLVKIIPKVPWKVIILQPSHSLLLLQINS